MRAAVLAVTLSFGAATLAAETPYEVDGDAIPAPLAGLAGDSRRGEAIVRSRETGNCLICHAIPVTAERFQGDLAPPLAGAGSRLMPGQIRLRLVDPTRVNPEAIMPSYHRTHGLVNVDERWAGRPVLSAQEIEDVVTYLSTLKEPPR